MNHPRSLRHPRVARWLIPLENYLGEYTLAGLVLRGFTLFLLLSSLAQLGLGVVWRLEGSQLASKYGASLLTHTQVFLCGPRGMSQSLIRQLRRLGKNRRDLISETFALRP